MNELSLFTGAGGGLLASRLLGWKTVCAVEIDDYCRRVLLQRQRDGMLDMFPIFDDVRNFDGRPWRGCVDIVSGGFPCQPWSIGAGKQPGERDERNLWPDTIRIIREVGPQHVFLENSAALVAHEYARTIFGNLAESGFDCRWDCLPAAFFGADHFRERIWIVAHARSQGPQGHQLQGMAGSQAKPLDAPRRLSRSARYTERRSNCSQSDVCRKADAVASYVDRLRALGNGQVPIVAASAWRILTNTDPERVQDVVKS